MDSSQQRSSAPNILSLPDELLLAIFAAVKSWRPANRARHADFASSSRDIASARLACRRFAAAGAHLLVHYVRVDGLSARALRRLEAVARHPLVGRGVRVVRLAAPYYAPALAAGLEGFALHAAARVFARALARRRALDDLEAAQAAQDGAREPDDRRLCLLLRRRAEIGATLETVKAILKAWIAISREGSAEVLDGEDTGPGALDDEENQQTERYARLLRLAHQLYRLRYDEQESLRKNNEFVNRFAAAMARMPKARTFEIQDFRHSPQARQDCEEGDATQAGASDDEVDNGLASVLDLDSLLGPTSWEDGLRGQLGSPPSEVLFALPAAMQRAGVRLDRFSVQTTVPAEQYYPMLREVDADEYARLGSAVDRMGVGSVSFVHGGGGGPQPPTARDTPPPEDVEAFRRYVAAMSGGEGLRRLRVVADGGWADGSLVDPGHHALLGATASWGRRLADVSLSNVSLRLEDLEDLAARAGEAGGGAGMDFLTLSRVRLVGGGTWRRALEALRRARAGDKELVEPLGAECDDPAALPSGWYEAVFGVGGPAGRRSVAERFINEEVEGNPLQEDWPVDSVCSVNEEGADVPPVVKTQDEDQFSMVVSDLDEETDGREAERE